MNDISEDCSNYGFGQHKRYEFTPQSKIVKTIEETFVDDIIKNEPMLFSCDFNTAKKLGGPITQAFIHKLIEFDSISNWIIDSRVHMLMNGWYPCIPGWHHDDVPRSRSDGQPNYSSPEYKAQHIMMIIDNGTGSLTEFLDSNIDLPEVRLGRKIYNAWNRTIKETQNKVIQIVKSGDLVYFDWNDFHRGMPATGSGWRFFIRATRNTQRPVLNELRRQVQVYLSPMEEG